MEKTEAEAELHLQSSNFPAKKINGTEYALLTTDEKTKFRADLKKIRSIYEDDRKQFFTFEKAVEKDNPSPQERDEEEKNELLDGIDELDRQERQINQIITMGYEAEGAQKEAGRNLRNQRDVISKAAKNTSNAARNLKRAHVKLTIISVRTMVYIGALYSIAGVLFLIII